MALPAFSQRLLDLLGIRQDGTLFEFNNQNNAVNGTNADEHFVMNGGNDAVNSGGGRDFLEGGTGNDALNGGDGNDYIEGGQGNDALNGGAGPNGGIDTLGYSQSSAGVTITLGNNGNGTGSGGDAANDAYSNFENVVGGKGNDTITGNSGVNVLAGLAGADKLYGMGGDDILIGGAGADRLDGGAGFDTADYSTSESPVAVTLGGVGTGGDAAGDTLFSIENLVGTAGADTFDGHNSLTGFSVSGGGGADTMIGGHGGDHLSLGGSSTALQAGLFALAAEEGGTLDGGGGDDTLTGDGADNTIRDGDGDDVASGGDGDDVFDIGSGNNDLSGDDGNDTFFFGDATGGSTDPSNPSDFGKVSGGPGDDEINFSGVTGGVDVVLSDPVAEFGIAAAGGGRMTYHNDYHQRGEWGGVDRFRMSDDDDTFDAHDYHHSSDAFSILAAGDPGLTVNTGAGNDTVTGTSGDDTLSGEAGNDNINGGIGNDKINAGAGNDIVKGGDGNDQIVVGPDASDVNGDAGDDEFIFNDATFGGGQALALAVEPWNLGTYNGGDDASNVGTFNGLSQGISIAMDSGDASGFAAAADEPPPELMTITVGSRPFFLNISDIPEFELTDFDDRFDGNSDLDIIKGRGGNDTLNGAGGDDTLVGEAGDDTIDGGTENDRLNGGDGNDFLFGGQGYDLLSGSNGDDWLVAGARGVSSGTGSFFDILEGGGGADRFDFDNASDIGDGHDKIMDFSLADGDKIDLVDVFGGEDFELQFIGNAAFSGQAGQLRFRPGEGAAEGEFNAIEGDLDGNRTVDFMLLVNRSAGDPTFDFFYL